MTGPGSRWRHRPKTGHLKKKQGTEGEVMKPKNGRAGSLGLCLVCCVIRSKADWRNQKALATVGGRGNWAPGPLGAVKRVAWAPGASRRRRQTRHGQCISVGGSSGAAVQVRLKVGERPFALQRNGCGK